MPLNLMAPIFDKSMQMGNAYILLGPPDVPFTSVQNWQEVGAIGGVGSFHPQPKHKTLLGGSPNVAGAVQRESDGYSFEIECYEVNLNNIILKYGYGGGPNPGTMNFETNEPVPSEYADSTPTGYPSSGLTASTSESKILYGYNWFHLLHRNLTSTLLTGTQGLTSLTEWNGTSGDFQVDRLRGFIRRVPGSQIIPGVACSFGYGYTTPPQGIATFTHGLSTYVPKFAAKFCVPTSDTTATVFNAYKVYAESSEPINYDSKDFWKMKMSFNGMPDFTRTIDDSLFSVNEEVYYLPSGTP